MSTVAIADRSCRCEPVQRTDEGGDERVSAAMTGVVEDEKLAGAPALRQSPRGFQRATDIAAAVDQDAGNAVQ
jgi:hypothetical protein